MSSIDQTTDTTTQHTPGPWEAYTQHKQPKEVRTQSGSLVATIRPDIKHGVANTVLMASAPDMLDHHRAILDYSAELLCQINAEHPLFNYIRAINNEAKRAIAKAEGRA